MFLTLLKAKLHRAVITSSDLTYEGSISIDADLLRASGILPNEQVDVLNINNGARFTTYAIAAQPGSRDIIVNGAAARLVQKDDVVIICAFASMSAEEAAQHQPTVILLDEHNHIKS
ncbi:MAG: aspartate 1-decarboxylase [Alphaproteobacteria bacterium]|nr:MAG: aspartate 1-decarboxylase [Alphaproteobacteria bacterium]TAF14405.1 MAG: aspartate 1-decarboxylase [Alphaproteobacteria bacterium]TAF39566.1 MAG: aspartate 1-decarboxylase [Alphaproteobacteria bacterium]TAF77549.1 MAG: aspartate 1-decarboxylase [Alphaproteobacteria bacterium]